MNNISFSQDAVITTKKETSEMKSIKRNDSAKNQTNSIENLRGNQTEPLLIAPEEIRSGLQKLGVTNLNQYELEEMFDEATQYMKMCSIEHNDFHVLDTGDGKSTNGSTTPTEIEHLCLPIGFLIAGSDAFRQKLLKMDTDPIFCNLMMSNLSSYISEKGIRTLSRNGKEREISRLRHKVFSSRSSDDKKRWSYIVSGKLKVSLDTSLPFSEEAVSDSFEIGAGEYFGGFGIQNTDEVYSHIVIETTETTKLLELSGEILEDFVRDHEETGRQLMSLMGGNFTNFETLRHNVNFLILASQLVLVSLIPSTTSCWQRKHGST